MFGLIAVTKWAKSYKAQLFALLLAALVARVYSLSINTRPSDDGWILYDIFAMRQGALPYRDFLYSKPPLYLITLFLFCEAFGYGYIQAKLFSYLLVAMTIVATYICARELFGEKIGVVAAFLVSTSILLIMAFLLLQIISLSALLFLVSFTFLIGDLKRGATGNKGGLLLFLAGFFLGATLLVRQTTWISIVFFLPLVLIVGKQCLGTETVGSTSQMGKEPLYLLSLWSAIILSSIILQLVGLRFAIPTSAFLGIFLLAYLLLSVKNAIDTRHKLDQKIQRTTLFGLGTIVLPVVILLWLICSGISLNLVFFNIFDAPTYDTSIVYHEMIVKQTFGVLFMAMNPLLMVGLFLYIALGVKDFSSRKHRLYDVDNLLRLLTIVGALSIFLLLPKFYPAYLIDVVPFMAIGAARGFSQAWNNRGVSKGLRLKSAKISVTISEHRVRALLCVGCIIIVGGSAVVYNSYVAFEPTLKRLGKTNNEITDAIVDYIQARTKPDERIFTIDHILAALSQRRIVGEVSTGIQIRSVWQLDECPYAGPQEIIALMRNGEGRYVIMDPHTSKTLKNWAPDLLDYIISAYIVEKVVEDVEIMGRTT